MDQCAPIFQLPLLVNPFVFMRIQVRCTIGAMRSIFVLWISRLLQASFHIRVPMVCLRTRWLGMRVLVHTCRISRSERYSWWESWKNKDSRKDYWKELGFIFVKFISCWFKNVALVCYTFMNNGFDFLKFLLSLKFVSCMCLFELIYGADNAVRCNNARSDRQKVFLPGVLKSFLKEGFLSSQQFFAARIITIWYV